MHHEQIGLPTFFFERLVIFLPPFSELKPVLRKDKVNQDYYCESSGKFHLPYLVLVGIEKKIAVKKKKKTLS